MQRNLTLSMLSLVLIAILVACGQSTPEATPTPIPTDTPIPTPTFTATPSTPLAILVIPPDLDQAMYDLYQSTVYNLAQQAGFRFQVRNTLSELDIEPALRVVIALPPDPGPGIAALAAAAPQTQFLAINVPGLTAGGNISVLANDVQTDIVAFMAGYIGAMIIDDYRIGMIYPDGNAEALSALDAYTNGMIYFCGTCQKYYLYQDEYGNALDFPQSIQIPADEAPANYGGYAVYLIQRRKVNYIYVYPDVATPELLAYVGSSGAVQVGSTPQGGIPLYWAASIGADTIGAIQAAWPNLIAGQGGQAVQSPLTLTDVDPNLFSPGKQAQAEQVLADLLAGRISPHGVP
ncbi:MAG: hypothetical protein KJ638_11965 [Chloroflexi bacterium]|nr:hypothetical protein [Chloroflexota bacterium]